MNTPGWRRIVQYFCGLSLLLGMGDWVNAGSDAGPNPREVDALHVERSWIRATPPGQRVAAAFLVLTSKGPEERVVLSLSSPLAGQVEIHRTVERNGQVRMEPVEQLVLPAGGQVELLPGGLHVMLMDLQRSLSPGDLVPLRLFLDGGEEHQTHVPVIDARRGDPDQSHDHHH